MANSGVFRFRSLSAAGIRHGVTGRRADLPDEGDISFLTGASEAAVRYNRAYWAAEIGVDPASITTARQVHGFSVAVVRAGDGGRGSERHQDGLCDVDGLMTDVPGITLMALAADCVPILLHDPVHRAVGAVHAGWRGTVAGIAPHVVQAMTETFDTRPEDLIVGLGPSIGPCCYEVGPEVIAAWDELGLDPERRAVIPREPRDILDLWSAHEIGLTSAGVRSDNIENARICTRCNSDRFFSRRSGMGHRGLFGALIALEGA